MTWYFTPRSKYVFVAANRTSFSLTFPHWALQTATLPQRSTCSAHTTNHCPQGLGPGAPPFGFPLLMGLPNLSARLWFCTVLLLLSRNRNNMREVEAHYFLSFRMNSWCHKYSFSRIFSPVTLLINISRREAHLTHPGPHKPHINLWFICSRKQNTYSPGVHYFSPDN